MSEREREIVARVKREAASGAMLMLGTSTAASQAMLSRLLALAERTAAAEATPAARDVLAERRRQVEVEGWTPEHDDAHSKGEIAAAAACYALHTGDVHVDLTASLWPWAYEWWKPTDRRRNLVKAGALILAEIERLDRLAAATPPQPARANEGGEG